MIVSDPDGNELYFPNPADGASCAAEAARSVKSRPGP
jgi:hypothetical protein